MIIKRLALMIPQLRRVRDQLHLVDRLHREAAADLERVTAERDLARKMVVELGGSSSDTPAAQSGAAVTASHGENTELERAYRACVALNDKLIARIGQQNLV